MNVIIPRTPHSVKAGEVFTTAMDASTEHADHVLQGEREKARDNWTLANSSSISKRAPNRLARVGVQLEIDADGILHVWRGSKDRRATIVTCIAVDVDDADVQQMVDRVVAHAFEDLGRAWIEAKQTASETMAAARKGMTECSRRNHFEYRSKINAGLAGVDRCWRAKSERRVGRRLKLKAGVAALDESLNLWPI